MSTIPATQQGPVEARSLSSITAIASNPPAYPRNPTHEKHDPLQLYIVRVPGSQDIFLSPLKPPTKSSVSAEAINASLYYLHVAAPEDDALLQEVEQEREEQAHRRRDEREAASVDDPAQREFARMNNVRRKPVGGDNLGHERAPAPAPMPAPMLAPAPMPVPMPAQENVAPPPLPRRPVPMPQVSAENMSFAGTPIANAPLDMNGEPRKESIDPTARRPLPPLPPHEEPLNEHLADDDQPRKTNRWSAFVDNVQTRGKEVWRERYENMSTGRHSLDSNRPQLPPRPSHDGFRSPNRSPGQSPTRQPRANQAPCGNAGFHITLIRRDPASGTQWNVGTISTPQMDRNAIDIEISTPGYNRFAGSQEPVSLANLAASLPPGMLRTGGPSMPPSLGPEHPAEQLQPRPPPQPTGPRKFHRQLCVSRQFEDSRTGGRSSADTGAGHIPDGSKLKSGYYAFNSPWNGTCTFSSSVNGRSLKCKHMILGVGNPPPGESNTPAAVTVAEIRFNTPFQAANLHFHASHRQHQHPHPHHSFTSNPTVNPPSPRNPREPSNPDSASKRNSLSQLLNPNNYARPRAHSGPNSPYTPDTPSSPRQNFNPSALLRRTSLRTARFSRHGEFRHQYPPSRPRSTSTSSGGPDSDEERLDLSLARELAGGGMRGKSAKLGKLVIEDEGIKMLDLVVAACMAVWWRGYYH
ncbi:uncharacterized protein N7482_003657 [Penicillium canariense]|uniref:Uncharacterized protein n=1 Tax=Penicillium canariense TaxID=189055 RepID=A0A9W9I749_9EURO|nr:uncharacterized protein N7482_003657 [Penicillium canariense]KAJ5168063.1 hypothetical protein N7482_003657 [Penicillium canariense]